MRHDDRGARGDRRERHATRFTDHGAYSSWVLHATRVRWPSVAAEHAGAIDDLYGVLSAVGAVGSAALGLFGRPLRESLPRSIQAQGRVGMRAVRGLHSGHIGDYIAWWTAGAGAFGAVCLLALR
ncbi:MAG: hypothetical protein M3065_10700 [Actinomycetota bacterium]|nr:hypothetical protein [Actinomycetota bacterium]